MKTYYSKGREYNIYVMMNGKPFAVRFRDMGQRLHRGVFCTDNKELAAALESHPRFNDMFFLVEGTIEPKEEPKPRVYDYTYHARRTQDAIRILVEMHGVDRDELKRKADLLKKADELNIAFPEL